MEAMRALTYYFTVEWETLEWVNVFKYLGQLMLMDDVDRQVINVNIKKAQHC